MAEIVASVLPFRPEHRPDSITRFAISVAFSGSSAARRTSIATCFADARHAVCCFAIVMASFSSSLLSCRWRGDEEAAARLRSCATDSAVVLRERAWLACRRARLPLVSGRVEGALVAVAGHMARIAQRVALLA
jgi:hypothetical protein